MNPYINTEDIEIDLIDLGRYLLRKIIPILVAGVICACLAGLYKYYRERTSVSQAETEVETELMSRLEKYEQESELIETSDVSTAELIRRQKDYLQNSLYMQLDPNHVWKAQTLIRVVSHSHDMPAYQLEELYRFDLSNIYFLKDLAQDRAIETSYLRELISSWSVGTAGETGDDTTDVVLRDQNFEDRVTSELFCVQTLGNTEQEAMELMNEALDALNQANEEYARKYSHDFEILSRHCAEGVDASLIAIQKDREIITQNLLLQMKDNQDKADILLAESKKPSAGGVSKKDLLKYGLIGFIGGIFLMCLWYALRYIRNDKLVDYKDLERRGLFLKELGSVPDQGAAMIAANIRNFAGDKRRLFLTGMTEQSSFDQVCEDLKSYLSGYEIVSARDVLHDAEARELLPDCDAAVLVEQSNVTHYSDIAQETTFLFNADKEIIGIVIV